MRLGRSPRGPSALVTLMMGGLGFRTPKLLLSPPVDQDGGAQVARCPTQNWRSWHPGAAPERSRQFCLFISVIPPHRRHCRCCLRITSSLCPPFTASMPITARIGMGLHPPSTLISATPRDQPSALLAMWCVEDQHGGPLGADMVMALMKGGTE